MMVLLLFRWDYKKRKARRAMPFQLTLDVDKKTKNHQALWCGTNNIITIVREVDGFNIIIIIIHWFQHQP